MTKTNHFLACATVATLVWTSTPVLAQSIEEALAAAYMNNPTLQARRAQLRATDQGVPIALSNWRPTVSVSGEAGLQRYRQEVGSVSSTRDTRPVSVGVSVAQPLFRGFRTEAEIDKAEMTVMAERAALRSVEQSVLLNTATAYVNVVRDDAVVDLNRNNEDVLGRQLQAARDRFRVGEITRTDVAQAEARLSGAKSDTASSVATLESSLATYLRLVGQPVRSLDAPDAVPDLPVSRDEALSRALASNPSIIAAEYTWRSAQDEIRNQRGRLLPTVDLEGAFSQGWDQSAVEDSNTRVFSATINVSVPIYQGGTVYSQLRQAKHIAGQRRLEFDEATTQVREETEQAWETLVATESRIESLRDQIDAAEIALEGVEREAQVGARTVLDVLDAEQELLNARVDMVLARRDRLVAGYSLLAAVGGLTADALSLPVTLYDPTANYKEVRDQWFGSSDAADGDAALGLGGRPAGGFAEPVPAN
ncbi:TolC family outer membrane protein [Roseospira visakhapatnamensis]|uniref:Outer membrane protein n=1 Tax=Roseospira visakhapatnamensis TaxID=390880 RepID=A0A7W6RBS8_9PROT|nr:TolC family outer membrane protein [Roseospira visakhapatnamensis]MBB4265003.1 outer membrane protein [Roseospira visakhapatnamensis]